MNIDPLLVLVVDDSMLFRKIVCDLLMEIDGVKVVGQAPNGKIALQKIESLKPDLMILDLDMPEMSGLEVLGEIKKQQLECGAIVVSGISPKMSAITIKALNAGAFEFVSKPTGSTIEETRNQLKQEFDLAVQAFQERVRIRKAMKMPVKSEDKAGSARDFARSLTRDHVRIENFKLKPFIGADLLVIGVSTGGPPALAQVFSQITQSPGIPIVIVQHIPPLFSEALAISLGEKSGLIFEEARPGKILEAGEIYVAPGGVQLKLIKSREPGKYAFQVTNDPPENNCRPSIDYFLKSVISNFSGRVAFLIMTGMGIDGLAGAKMIKEAGGYVMAQDKESCVVFGMPKAVIEAGLADGTISLGNISPWIERISRGSGQK